MADITENKGESGDSLEKAIRKKRIWLTANGVFLLISLALLLAVYKLSSDSYLNKISSIREEWAVRSEPEIITDRKTQRRLLDGIMVEPGGENLRPFAVMIENHVDSRPAAGLARAQLVYEAEAEGGITRFLAVFAGDEKIESIGPVRSARPYYLDWAEELDAVYVHCGGSAEALARIIDEDVIDMNEFYNAGYFWRDSRKPAPHNVYTSSEKLFEFSLAKRIATSTSFDTWTFKNDSPDSERPEKASTTINFRGAQFVVDWVYNKQDNDYTRIMGGDIHTDESGDAIKAKNIVIQYIPAFVQDDYMRLKMETIGTGKSVICQDGICLAGGWSKEDNTARTRFYYEKTEPETGAVTLREAEFNPGTTWIEVVRPEIEVRY